MSEIKVTFGALVAAQGDIATTSAALNGQLNDLKAQLAPMVSTWTGDAATNYQAFQHKWDLAQADLNRVLQEVAKLVGGAHEGYVSGENRIKGMFAI